MMRLDNEAGVTRYVAESEIKLLAERNGDTVLITLPCGQKRTMHKEQFRKLMQRGNDLLEWLGMPKDTKEF